MKNIAKALIVAILGWQLRRLRRKHNIVTVGVVGSIGKTSTKFAVAQMLGTVKNVRYQEGNYNDIVTVPLVFFNEALPNLFSVTAWLRLFMRNEKQIRSEHQPEVVVVELGTDTPGDIAAFRKYMQLDVALITAITPEHMEFFDDLDAVAKEELSIVQYADELVCNNDLVADEYRSLIPEAVTYGFDENADYRVSHYAVDSGGARVTVEAGSFSVELQPEIISKIQVYSVLAGVIVCRKLGLTNKEIIDSLQALKPVSGRMQLLQGIHQATIIDDTYNASPEAMRAGLEMVFEHEAPQKIVLLGNMNELGSMSAQAHTDIGMLCDPKKLDEVITLGVDANTYLAAAAEQNGCKVSRFNSPYEAGEYIQSVTKRGALIFAKGSQNGVFAEEALKPLLADKADESKLVRQSDSWLAKKKRSFSL